MLSATVDADVGCPLKEVLWLRFAHNYIHAEAAYIFFSKVTSADGEDDNLCMIVRGYLYNFIQGFGSKRLAANKCDVTVGHEIKRVIAGCDWYTAEPPADEPFVEVACLDIDFSYTKRVDKIAYNADVCNELPTDGLELACYLGND